MKSSDILTVVPWLLLSGCSFDGFIKAGLDHEGPENAARASDGRSSRSTAGRDGEDAGRQVSPSDTRSRTTGSNDATTHVEPTDHTSSGANPGSPSNDTDGDRTSDDRALDETGTYGSDTGGDSGTSFADDRDKDADRDDTDSSDNEVDDSDDSDDSDTTKNNNDTTSTPDGTDTATETATPTTNDATDDATDDEPSHACETLILEGFDNVAALPASGWALQNNSAPFGPTDWMQGDANVFPAHDGDPHSFIVGSYTNADSAGTISNWLLTPEVTLENDAVLAFWTRSVGSQFADRLQVRLSTNGDSTNVGNSAVDVGDFTHLLLDINPSYLPSDYPAEFTRFDVTISGLLKTTTGRLAFRYFVEDGGPMGTRSDYIGLDSVMYPFCDAETDDTDTSSDTDDTTADTSAAPVDTTSTDTFDTTSGDTSDTSDDTSTRDETHAPSYQLTVSDGDAQTALVGYSPNVTPKVRVLNEHGAGVNGVEVTFAAVFGGGAVTGAVQTTDALGYASPGKWTLGTSAGPNQLKATVAGPNGPQSLAINATGTLSNYHITLQYVTAISPEHEAVFEAARDRWQELIIGDLPSLNQYIPADVCGTHPAITTPIDDLLILVSVGPIDGVNNVLGQAGPCIVRAVGAGGLPAAGASGLPAVGTMLFDVDDLDSMSNGGQLEAVILHEMGHVLGLNSTYWRSNGLLQNPMPSSPSNDTHFTGSHARDAFLAVGGATYAGTPVPVENCVGIPGCGAGTYNSHWREFALDNELMTGFVSPPGTPNPLSRVTVAALWDVGYVVNMDGADPYYKTFSNLLGLQAMSHRTQLRELPYEGPLYVVDDDGLSLVDGNQ